MPVEGIATSANHRFTAASAGCRVEGRPPPRSASRDTGRSGSEVVDRRAGLVAGDDRPAPGHAALDLPSGARHLAFELAIELTATARSASGTDDRSARAVAPSMRSAAATMSSPTTAGRAARPGRGSPARRCGRPTRWEAVDQVGVGVGLDAALELDGDGVEAALDDAAGVGQAVLHDLVVVARRAQSDRGQAARSAGSSKVISFSTETSALRA